MTSKILKDVMERVESWPEEVQAELAAVALEIDATLAGGVYHATKEELRAIDEADRSGSASDKQVEAAFRAFRRARNLSTRNERQSIFATRRPMAANLERRYA